MFNRKFAQEWTSATEPIKATVVDFEHDRQKLTLKLDDVKVEISYDRIKSVTANEIEAKVFLEVSRAPEVRLPPSSNWNQPPWVDCLRLRVAECNYICLAFEHANTVYLRQVLKRLQSRMRIQIWHMYVKHLEPMPEFPERHALQLRLNKLPFAAAYALDGLSMRGCSAIPSTAFDWDYWSLVESVSSEIQNDPASATRALESLLAAVDERRDMHIPTAFAILFNSLSSNTELSEKVWQPNRYLTMRKVVLTPTRILPCTPETLVGNRVWRQFDADFGIRVQCRSDDGRRLHSGMLRADDNNRFRQLWNNGLTIGSRSYQVVGWSNSQLRDHGFYMSTPYIFNGCTTIDANRIRQWMGIDKIYDVVPKIMARIGQCFTQAQKSIGLGEDDYITEKDVFGGPATNGLLYNHSDGVGMVSVATAKQIMSLIDDNYHYLPSAYQVRFNGFKGMLSLVADPSFTYPKVVFRESMKKYIATNSTHLEIVKLSKPTRVSINRPLIVILEQVAERGNDEGPVSRIRELFDDELLMLADMFHDNSTSAHVLQSTMKLGINFQYLRKCGVHLHLEPFFRQVLLCYHSYTLRNDLVNGKLTLQWNLGRSLLGVLDESGLLPEGTIFVQYSSSHRRPGRTMITKYPCIHPGDVRVVEAIDLPELHHYNDVIVFSQRGYRPLPDQMAGSDLDGNEYAVFWDKQMLLQQDADPADYCTQQNGGIPQTGVAEMFEHFISYMNSVSIGQIANAHLAMANIHGIFSNECESLAIKCSQAVDYPKSGILADGLSNSDKTRVQPDFMQRDHLPNVESYQFAGILYRKVRMVLSTMENAKGDWQATYVSETPLSRLATAYEVELLEYFDDAMLQRQCYRVHIEALKLSYGNVESEASLMSGCLAGLRNRVNERNKDEISAHNTNSLIRLKLAEIWKFIRANFFQAFGGESKYVNQDDNDANNRWLCELPLEMQLKALAWYYITQKDPVSSGISLPWIVWDVLAYTLQRSQLSDLNPSHQPMISTRATFGHASSHLVLYSIDITTIYSFAKRQAWINAYPNMEISVADTNSAAVMAAYHRASITGSFDFVDETIRQTNMAHVLEIPTQAYSEVRKSFLQLPGLINVNVRPMEETRYARNHSKQKRRYFVSGVGTI